MAFVGAIYISTNDARTKRLDAVVAGNIVAIEMSYVTDRLRTYLSVVIGQLQRAENKAMSADMFVHMMDDLKRYPAWRAHDFLPIVPFSRDAALDLTNAFQWVGSIVATLELITTNGALQTEQGRKEAAGKLIPFVGVTIDLLKASREHGIKPSIDVTLL